MRSQLECPKERRRDERREEKTNRRTLLLGRARRLGPDSGVATSSKETESVPLLVDGDGLDGRRDREEGDGDDGSKVHVGCGCWCCCWLLLLLG
jgi:hypothetical protein